MDETLHEVENEGNVETEFSEENIQHEGKQHEGYADEEFRYRADHQLECAQRQEKEHARDKHGHVRCAGFEKDPVCFSIHKNIMQGTVLIMY